MNSKDFYILKTLYQKYGFEKVQVVLEHINNIIEIKKENNKWYILKYKNQIILKEKYTQKDKIKSHNFENYKMIKFGKRMIQQFNNKTIELIFYRWDGIGEPIIPTINKNTGEITDWQIGSEAIFFKNIIDEVVKENIRVQQGGSANYEKLDLDGTQKIIFDFEIMNEIDSEQCKKVVYRMILTINQAQIIRSGNISLVHYLNEQFDEDKLNFEFEFMQSALTNKNEQALWDFKINNYLYRNEKKIILEQLKWLIDLNDFLKQFFSNVLMPLFTNRGAFLEANYLDFLTYDIVVVNFLGLNANNFLAVLDCDNFIDNEQRIDYQNKWKNILYSSFKIMQGFYKDYLRVMFDLENRTYIQGYNKKFGLLVSNGFKIFPKYFYFSDKYKNLDVKIYSSHANKFYQTKYGKVFNFDYSVWNNFEVDYKYDYLFDGEQNVKNIDCELKIYQFKK